MGLESLHLEGFSVVGGAQAAGPQIILGCSKRTGHGDSKGSFL